MSRSIFLSLMDFILSSLWDICCLMSIPYILFVPSVCPVKIRAAEGRVFKYAFPKLYIIKRLKDFRLKYCLSLPIHHPMWIRRKQHRFPLAWIVHYYRVVFLYDFPVACYLNIHIRGYAYEIFAVFDDVGTPFINAFYTYQPPADPFFLVQKVKLAGFLRIIRRRRV